MSIAVRTEFLKEFFGRRPAAPTEVSIHKEIRNFGMLVLCSLSTRLLVPCFPRALDERLQRKRAKLEYAENSAGLFTSRKRLVDLLQDRESLRFVSILTTISVPITTRLIRNAIFGDDDIDKITDDYGVLNFDAIYTDAGVVDMLLNGYCPVELVAQNENQFVWTGNYDAYEFGQQLRFPNVEIIMERQNAQSMVLRKITLTEREATPITSTPGDENWHEAKKIAWGVVQYDGILRFHSGLCHMLVEQYMVAVERNLSPENPIRTLLQPHLKHVRGTNYLADHLVWGEHQLTVAFGPFTHASSGAFIRDYVKKIDWKTWRLQQPLGDFHRYATAGELFMAVLDEYLARYFAQHRDAILQAKQELLNASADLVAYSLESAPGVPSASPILQENDADELVLQNVQTFCRFLIFQVCFAHCWSHLALATGYPLNPFAEKFDYQNIKRASKGMQIAQATHFAHRKRGGLPKMMDQADGALGSTLLELLESRRTEFANLGLDIDYLLESLV